MFATIPIAPKIYRSVPVARRFNVHGVAVELAGAWNMLDPFIDAWLRPFAVPHDGVEASRLPVSGTLRKYDQREVVRHLSPKAVRLADAGLTELYQEGERFWLVDDRWGMTEVNLLKSSWRTWLLPNPTLDPVRCAEMALMWPMAQLLRGRGLTLLPAVSVAREDRGVLILSPMGIEAELTAMIRSGYRMIGQRWSCVREKGAAAELLHLPGLVESARVPQIDVSDEWVDLEGEFCGSSQASARCDTVVIVQPARRQAANARELTQVEAQDAIRRGWPMIELHRSRRQILAKLASSCRCLGVQLSRRAEDLVDVLQNEPNRSDNPFTISSRRFVNATVRAA